jgi:type I restriction enzyme S subunit
MRDIVPGSEIKTKSQQVCRAGDFLVAEIDAKVGGFGIVPLDLEGAIVSSHYFLFEVDASRLSADYLGYCLKTTSFRDQVTAQGSTNYAAIRPADVLTYRIPLPPLEEQTRIVARLDRLAEKITAAQDSASWIEKALSTLEKGILRELIGDHLKASKPLSRILSEPTLNGLSACPSGFPPGEPILRISAGTARPDFVVDEDQTRFVVIDDADKARYRLQNGDLLACRFNGNKHFVGRFSLYTAYSGAAQVYPDKLIRIRVDRNQAIPEYVCIAMNSPAVRESIESLCATTAGNIGISATALREVELPVPSISTQTEIVGAYRGIQARLAKLRSLGGKRQAELSALSRSLLNRTLSNDV